MSSTYGGADTKRRVARARNYAENLAGRQHALPELSLISFAPYRVVRIARVHCHHEHREWRIVDYALRGTAKQVFQKGKGCKWPHRFGDRVWGVIGQETPGLSPLIMETFGCRLMAVALQQDLTFKAAAAIMTRER